MTCSDVQRILPEVVDGAPDSTFQTAVESHLQSCPACADLVSDLKLIASAALELTASEEPSPRVWLGIAAQLRAEGLIREPESAPTKGPILTPAPAARRWTSAAWWLAPVAASLLVAGSYIVTHKAAAPVAKQAPASPGATTVAEAPSGGQVSGNQATSTAETAAVTSPSASTPAAQSQPQTATSKAAVPAAVVASATKPTVEPEQSAEDQKFLSVVSTRAPSLRATYESQLQAVNNNIREVQTYLQQNPGDADARQQLMEAYQQKALLYQIALDRIQ